MEFALPTVLAQQIVNYDPVLKKELKARKAATSGTKRKTTEFPLYLVNDLIPHHIVSEVDQTHAAKVINRADLKERCVPFYKVRMDSENNLVRDLIAILYHYESAWFAAWFPADEEKDKYIYGFAVAFRNLSKASEKAISLGLSRDSMKPLWDAEYRTYNKKEFRVHTHQLTADDIANDHCTGSMWNIPSMTSYHKKSSHMFRTVINPFQDRLKSLVNSWEDSYGMWERINPKKNNYGAILSEYGHRNVKFPFDFFPSAENFLSKFKPLDRLDYPDHESFHTAIRDNQGFGLEKQVYEKLYTPFFRKWIQLQCDEIVAKFNDPATTTKKSVCAPYARIHRLISWMKWVLAVWPDTPVDHFQNHIDQMMCIYCPKENVYGEFDPYHPDHVWLRKHMKVGSVFSIIDSMYRTFHDDMDKKVNEMDEESREKYKSRWFNHTLEVYCPSVYSNEFRDTINMLTKVVMHRLNNNLPELEPPRRWRLAEFHNHVQAEAWKITNENIDLLQDLFPQPIKVEHEEETWTFFQPMNTHQLAAWGQAVRNCVGSASSYAEGVNKKQHFIVLCMISNAPRFTIQLKVTNGVMHVVQITDLSNASLASHLQSKYSKLFKMALDIRANQLAAKMHKEEEKEEVVAS